MRLTNAQVRHYLAEAGVEVSRWTIRRILLNDLLYTKTPGGHRRYEPSAVAALIRLQGLQPGPTLQALLEDPDARG